MMINKLDYNKWLKHLDTQLNESTSQNSKFNPPKLLSQRNHKTLRTSTNAPPFLEFFKKLPKIFKARLYFSVFLELYF